MNWQIQLIFWLPFSLTAIILLGLFYLELKTEVSSRTVGKALAIIISVYFLKIAAQSVYIYFSLKGDELGQHFLPGKGTNYFYQMLWNISQPYLWALAIGLVLVLILFVLRKIMHSSMVDRSDLLIIILTVFVVGASSVLLLIIGSFLLMIFFLSGFNIRKRKIDTRLRLKLAPFLLLVAFIILILSNFNFYWHFLALLRLT